tara:strand:- start:3108 stop:3731 length:624 start_codon:yes stop_codon:yes gene_type:complete
MIYLAFTDKHGIFDNETQAFADYSEMSVWAKAHKISPTKLYNTGRKPTDKRYVAFVNYRHFQATKVTKATFEAHTTNTVKPARTFADVREDAIAAGDRNYCAPLAIALATDTSFTKSAEMMETYGRKKGKGSSVNMITRSLRSLGFKIEDQPQFAKGTVSTIANRLEADSTYMVQVRRHIICVKNGEVQDWTAGRKHRVTHVWKITA